MNNINLSLNSGHQHDHFYSYLRHKMKYVFLFIATFSILLSVSPQANATSIAGTWQCQVSFDFPQAEGFLQDTQASFVINDNQTEYEREGKIRISFKDLPSLVLEAQTYEKGTLERVASQLIISPVKAEVKMINSGPLDKNLLQSQLLTPLSKQEVWDITTLTASQLEMKVSGNPVTNRCKKN